MKIAVVDGDAKCRVQAVRLLELMFEQSGGGAEVASFATSESLLSARKENGPFDMYLLEVVMSDIDGIELGKRIRLDQPEAPLLYFTTSRDFAVEAIGLEAVGYVLKPFTHDEFALVLKRALKRLAAVSLPELKLRTMGGLTSLRMRDFVCAEVSGHHVTIHVANRHTFILRLSAQELWSKLEGDARFFRVSRQLMVNLEHVKSLANGSGVLSNGRTFSVPRRAVVALRDAFMHFHGV